METKTPGPVFSLRMIRNEMKTQGHELSTAQKHGRVFFTKKTKQKTTHCGDYAIGSYSLTKTWVIFPGSLKTVLFPTFLIFLSTITNLKAVSC